MFGGDGLFLADDRDMTSPRGGFGLVEMLVVLAPSPREAAPGITTNVYLRNN
jgi:hypothetical protein